MRRLLLFWLTVAAAYLAWALLRSTEPRGVGQDPELPSQRCEAETRSGERCSRDAEPGSPYCWQHQPV